MKIIMANDHGAIDLASKFYKNLKKDGYNIIWKGVKENISVDYPDQAELACKEYLNDNSYDFIILLCGTGIGISISANKIKGIRCALPSDIYGAKMAKEHNNANAIAFGGRIEYKEDPYQMLKAFIDSSFQGDRHQRRINKIMTLENN